MRDSVTYESNIHVHQYVRKFRARVAYAKFIRRWEIRAFALISRRNLNAYHVPPRRVSTAVAGIIITEQLSCGSLGPFARWQTRRRRFTYLSDIRPCLTINSRWRISQVTLKFHEWLSTDKSPSWSINPIADERTTVVPAIDVNGYTIRIIADNLSPFVYLRARAPYPWYYFVILGY